MTVINASNLFGSGFTQQCKNAMDLWNQTFKNNFMLDASNIITNIKQSLIKDKCNLDVLDCFNISAICVNDVHDGLFSNHKSFSLQFSLRVKGKKSLDFCEFLFIDHRDDKDINESGNGSNALMLTGFKNFTENYFLEYIDSTGKAFLTNHPDSESVEKLKNVMYITGLLNGTAHGLFRLHAKSHITFNAGRDKQDRDINIWSTSADGLFMHYSLRTEAIDEWLGIRRV